MTEVQDFAVLTKRHEPISRASCAIAGRAEAGNMIVVQKPANNFVKRALVGNVKLLSVMGALFFHVTANRGTRATTNLRNSVLKSMFADSLAFAGRNNHAGVRHRNANKRNKFFEHLIRNAVVKFVRINIHGGFYARNTDGVRTYAVYRFEVLCVHEESSEFIAIAL